MRGSYWFGEILLALCLVSIGGVSSGETLAQATANADAETRTDASPLSIEIGLLATGERRVEVRPGATTWILGEIDSFVAAHPEIKVTTLNVDDQRWVRPIERCPTLPRNVVGISSEAGYETAYLAVREEIVPIDDFLPDPEFSKDDFYDNMWEPVQFDGKTWGVPWATTVPFLVCNWTLFEEAGISTPPRTWEQFLRCAQELTRDTDGDGVKDQVGCEYLTSGVCEYLMGHIAVQKGAQIVTRGGFALWSTEVGESFSLVQTIAETVNSLAPQSADPTTKWAMRVGFTRGDEDELKTRPGSTYRLAYLPTCGEEVLADFDTLYLAVRKSTPREEAAAWELIKWISRRDVALPKTVGGYPVRKDFIDREDFEAWTVRGCQNLEVLWNSNARLTQFGPHQVVGRYAGIWELADSVSAAFSRGASPEEAWNETVRRLNEHVKVLTTPAGKKYELFK